jgi:hypothetical protein
MKARCRVWSVLFAQARPGASPTPECHDDRFPARGYFVCGISVDERDHGVALLLDRGKRRRQQLRGQVLAGMRHLRGEIRHDTVTRGGGMRVDLVGDAGQQTIETVVIFAGILGMAVDPGARAVGKNLRPRQATRIRVGDPMRQPAKAVAGGDLPRRRASEQGARNRRPRPCGELGQMRVKFCASRHSTPAPRSGAGPRLLPSRRRPCAEWAIANVVARARRRPRVRPASAVRIRATVRAGAAPFVLHRPALSARSPAGGNRCPTAA